MTNRMVENNKVYLTGKIASGFTYSHRVMGENFYTIKLAAKRISGTEDILPLLVSERLMDIRKDYAGCVMEVFGQFRSYNFHEETGNRLILSVFVQQGSITEPAGPKWNNQIFMDGYICKPPVYRKTPLGRNIADLLLAVNRPYGKSDYIPCIIWGRNALFAAALEVGTRVNIWGRIQSREYVKHLGQAESEVRMAYEVSISRLEVANEA